VIGLNYILIDEVGTWGAGTGIKGTEYQRFAKQKIQDILKDCPFDDTLSR